MKKLFIIIVMILLFICAVYIGFWLWLSIEGVKMGSFDMFPIADDIDAYRFMWLLSAIFTSFLEIAIVFIEIALFRKLKRYRRGLK